MANRILFVCLGNICRSPAAEAVLRKQNPHLEIDSAGTSRWHTGEPPYAPMQTAARQRGVDLSSLRARQFGVNDFTAFDLILVMDAQNRKDVEALRPAGNTTPVRLFTEFATASPHDHVPDPYYTRDFDGCLDLIEDAAADLSAAVAEI
ncbi:low molecular weight phosphotyrosine protein phosphatase [Epibacterium sp. SM1979]|uniref:protein-tyrosine-phosphatase n=1 Tax=Tritonibacter litoralis TaxID=2662264 RepID=A0A843YDJ1_9RHOB|nr:low molecular weight phosphotyrosine protein phosphatase [Tritonibacter litoralis]